MSAHASTTVGGAGSGTAAPLVAGEFDRPAFAAAIGPHATERYLARFQRMHRGDGYVGWHWPAFFATLFWLLYRKQWGVAAAWFFAASIVPALLTLLVAALVPPLAWVANLTGLVAVLVLPALFADAVYYRGCSRLVAGARARTHSRDEQIGLLTGRGGTSRVALLAAGVLPLMAIVGMLAAIALPAYHDYTIRAKLAEAVMVALRTSSSVDAFHARSGRFPASVQEAGAAPAVLPFVEAVTIDPDDGSITVAVAIDSRTRGRVVLTRSEGAGGSPKWTCRSPDLEPRVLPEACRPPRSGSTNSTG